MIGYSAGRDLKRMPSEVYWQGLGSWGLRKLDLGLAEYGQRAAAIGRGRARRDEGEGESGHIGMWAPGLEPPDDFLNTELSFDLDEQEALLLADHIQRRHPRSLLAALSREPEAAAGVEFPWQVPSNVVPDYLSEILHHARCFSELTVGPQHLYNLLLARDAESDFKWDTGGLATREAQHLSEWAELVGGSNELSDWVDDLPALWEALPNADEIPDRTKKFVEEIVRRAVDDPGGFASDSTLHCTN